MTKVLAHDQHWWRVIGPYPLRAWVVFWGVGAVSFIASTAINRDALLAHPLSAILQIVFSSVLGTLVFASVLALGARTFPDRAPRNLAVYIFFILGASGIGSAVNFIVGRAIGAVSAEDIVFVPYQALRGLSWSMFLLAIAGITVRRLTKQTRIAEQALAVSIQQQQVMLINEEHSRRQVSALLHDRVQAGLMAACLELRMSAKEQGFVGNEQIEHIVAKIDGIRGMDVRQAARTLSPDLENIDLRTALTELAQIHEPAMTTTLDLNTAFTAHASVLDPDLLLACYRVCEQAMLNAVVHGHASQCRVTMIEDEDSNVVLTVRDNGTSAEVNNSSPGFGSAIFDAWCRVLQGSWTLHKQSEGGAVLTARFPNASEATDSIVGTQMSRL